MEYTSFLEAKRIVSLPTGLEHVPPLGDYLYPHQKAVVAWAARRGRAAALLPTGLGKSRIALEWSRIVVDHTGGRVLILTPLAVARQFEREAQSIGIDVTVCRTAADVHDGINIINYDRLHHVDPKQFVGVVADESSCLKDYTSATRNALIDSFADTKWKLSCTATPAPNDFTELGNQAEFLGVLSRTHMLSTFFEHDGGSTQDWYLKKHGEEAFWEWCASWGALIQRPSDLGFDDSAYNLPPLEVHDHVIPGDIEQAHKAGMLFVMPAKGLNEQRRARRSSLERRVELAAALAAAEPNEQWCFWVDLNDEGDALEELIPGAVQIRGSDSADSKEERILAFADGRIRTLITKASISGHGVNWQSCARTAFVGCGYSFEQVFQASRRFWRHGQTRPVHVHFIVGEAELGALETIRRKEREATRMATQMSAHTQRYVVANVLGAKSEQKTYSPRVRAKVPSWLKRSVA